MLPETECPLCHEAIPVPDQEAAPCPACRGSLRFVDAPEIPCRACGKTIPVLPSQQAVRCVCGHHQAVEEGRPLRFVATCPRCRRRIDVPSDAAGHTCPHCTTTLRFQDTL